MNNYKPLPCKFLFQIHNVLLTLVSGTLLALLFEQLFPQLYRKGIYFTICSENAWTPQLELIYYLNYLVKWWELVDTGFLVIKKKKLGKWFDLCNCSNLDTRLITGYRIFALLSS